MDYAQWTGVLSRSLTRFGDQLADSLPSLLGAALVLLVGWLLAWLLGAWTARLSRGLDRFVRSRPLPSGKSPLGMDRPASDIVSRIVFWVVFLFFVAAATEILGLPVVTLGISRAAYYLPRVLIAATIVVGGLVVAQLAGDAVTRAALSAEVAYAAALGRTTQVVILLIAVVIGVEQLGIDSRFLTATVTIVIGATIGGAALAFGLGARTTVSNVIASYYLVQTYRVGHTVKIGAVQGRILEITPTAVILGTPEGRVHIPAKEFSEATSVLVTDGG